MKYEAGLWCGSHDGEMFRGAPGKTPREAFDEWDDDDSPCVAVGQLADLRKFTGHARDIIENMECRAGDVGHPDLDCDLHGVTKDNLAELDAEIADVLKRWCEKHNVGFSSFGVENIVRCDANGPKESPNA